MTDEEWPDDMEFDAPENDAPIRYIVFDLETGGTTPQHAIVSFGVIGLGADFNEMFHAYEIVREDKPVEDSALEVNGITREQISAGKPIDGVLQEFANLWISNPAAIVCHNAAFDCGFLNVRGFKIEKAIDTMWISRRHYPGMGSSLAECVKREGLPVADAHNALGDVRMTAALLKAYGQKWPKELEPRRIITRPTVEDWGSLMRPDYIKIEKDGGSEGIWLVSGNTYPYRQRFASLGCDFIKGFKAWRCTRQDLEDLGLWGLLLARAKHGEDASDKGERSEKEIPGR